jgi:hypothetical protein
MHRKVEVASPPSSGRYPSRAPVTDANPATLDMMPTPAKTPQLQAAALRAELLPAPHRDRAVDAHESPARSRSYGKVRNNQLECGSHPRACALTAPVRYLASLSSSSYRGRGDPQMPRQFASGAPTLTAVLELGKSR